AGLGFARIRLFGNDGKAIEACPPVADSVEKVGVLTPSNFFTLWVRFSVSDAGGLIIHLRLNGASSKSICGGNKRESKMSLVFRQICSDYRLATFSTESANRRHRAGPLRHICLSMAEVAASLSPARHP